MQWTGEIGDAETNDDLITSAYQDWTSRILISRLCKRTKENLTMELQETSSKLNLRRDHSPIGRSMISSH